MTNPERCKRKRGPLAAKRRGKRRYFIFFTGTLSFVADGYGEMPLQPCESGRIELNRQQWLKARRIAAKHQRCPQ